MGCRVTAPSIDQIWVRLLWALCLMRPEGGLPSPSLRSPVLARIPSSWCSHHPPAWSLIRFPSHHLPGDFWSPHMSSASILTGRLSQNPPLAQCFLLVTLHPLTAACSLAEVRTCLFCIQYRAQFYTKVSLPLLQQFWSKIYFNCFNYCPALAFLGQ